MLYEGICFRWSWKPRTSRTGARRGLSTPLHTQDLHLQAGNGCGCHAQVTLHGLYHRILKPLPLPPGTGPKAELAPMSPRLPLGIQSEITLHVSCLPVLSSHRPPWMSLATDREYQLLLEGGTQCEIGWSFLGLSPHVC